MDSVTPAGSASRSTEPPDAPAYSAEMLAAAHRMNRERLRFALPATVLSLGGYVLIAALTGFTSLLDHKVHGELSWTLFLMMLLVPLVWALALAYRRRADRWDAMAAELRTSVTGEDAR
ncbi:DUF485 domain-containing protein [Patulibacter sp. S7RM1-6]